MYSVHNAKTKCKAMKSSVPTSLFPSPPSTPKKSARNPQFFFPPNLPLPSPLPSPPPPSKYIYIYTYMYIYIPIP